MHCRSALGSNQLWSHLSCLKTSHVALCLFQTITKSYPPLPVKDLLIIHVVSRADLAFNNVELLPDRHLAVRIIFGYLAEVCQHKSTVLSPTSHDTHLNPQCTLPGGVALSFVYCKISCTYNLYVDLFILFRTSPMSLMIFEVFWNVTYRIGFFLWVCSHTFK